MVRWVGMENVVKMARYDMIKKEAKRKFHIDGTLLRRLGWIEQN